MVSDVCMLNAAYEGQDKAPTKLPDQGKHQSYQTAFVRTHALLSVCSQHQGQLPVSEDSKEAALAKGLRHKVTYRNRQGYSTLVAVS